MRYPYEIVQKSFHNREAWVNVLLFKHITIPLVYLMVNYTKITPNIISILSLFFGFGSAYAYFDGHVVIGGVLYFISYIFDATDGKVARIKKNGNVYGGWFDIAIDRVNLTLISTAISYNYFLQHDSTFLVFLNCIFLGISFIGSESRYNINIYMLKNNIKDSVTPPVSSYGRWCERMGLIKEPISLPELFLFYLIISPQFGIEKITLLIAIFMLGIRLIKQQLFWINVTKD